MKKNLNYSMLSQKKDNKKIAIIGTSPISMIIYHLNIKLGNKVKIFENSLYAGGAWQQINILGKKFNKHTNVIVPANFIEETMQSKLNNSLKKNFNVKITKSKKKHIPIGYLSKKNFTYDLDSIYKIKPNDIIKKKIEEIEIKKNQVKIDSKKYDKVYIPFFSSIKKIRINKNIYFTPYKIINSKHIFIIIGKKVLNEFLYTEKFDDVFDRCQINYVGEKTILTARVRHEYKKFTKINIINKSSLKQFTDHIEFIKVIRYKNYYRNLEDLKLLKNLNKFKNIEIINTFQFYEGYLELMKKYDL